MYLTKLFLKNFRNYNTLELNLNKNLNLFIGNNAQGKTNALEAIYILSTGNSHRTNISSEMINWEKKESYIKGDILKREQKFEIELLIKGRGKKVKVNSNLLPKISDLLGYLNAVIFSPEDLKLVKGSPDRRRKFINLEISQVNSYYRHNLKDYNQVLKQRNNLLRKMKEKKNKKDDQKMLAVWDQQLIDLGSKIIFKRLETIDKLGILARLMHRKITGGLESLKLDYKSSLRLSSNSDLDEIRNSFSEKIESSREQEIERGYSMVGPHRHDIIFEVNDIDIRKYGSQGQQRTTALALKLAELEFMKSEIGEYPILLLDDVFSELDTRRRSYLLKVIENKVQTFITSTEIDKELKQINLNKNIYLVEEGILTSMQGG